METKYKTFLILIVSLASFVLSGFPSSNLFAEETERRDPHQSSKCLEAVREFADNVLKYRWDTYGPKHTPLFVEGLNIHTQELGRSILINCNELSEGNLNWFHLTNR